MSPGQDADRSARRSDEGQERRIAVIGDVGGQLEDLRTELRRLGADPEDGRLPPDLTVIQVGDLIHRGPDSEGVIRLVDHYLYRQPGQWVQLVGNHEAHYLRKPVFDWPERMGNGSVATLRRWWDNGKMGAAASVTTAAESFLITHAGLTAGFWRDVLGAPSTAEETAAAVNSLVHTQEDVLFRAGHMLRGQQSTQAAGPIWAAAATELVPGWLSTRLPFSQVHGHASLYDWQQGQLRASADIARLTRVDKAAKHETTTLDGGRIIGIDPGHGRHAQRPWRAWELHTRPMDDLPA